MEEDVFTYRNIILLKDDAAKKYKENGFRITDPRWTLWFRESTRNLVTADFNQMQEVIKNFTRITRNWDTIDKILLYLLNTVHGDALFNTMYYHFLNADKPSQEIYSLIQRCLLLKVNKQTQMVDAGSVIVDTDTPMDQLFDQIMDVLKTDEYEGIIQTIPYACYADPIIIEQLVEFDLMRWVRVHTENTQFWESAMPMFNALAMSDDKHVISKLIHSGFVDELIKHVQFSNLINLPSFVDGAALFLLNICCSVSHRDELQALGINLAINKLSQVSLHPAIYFAKFVSQQSVAFDRNDVTIKEIDFLLDIVDMFCEVGSFAVNKLPVVSLKNGACILSLVIQSRISQRNLIDRDEMTNKIWSMFCNRSRYELSLATYKEILYLLYGLIFDEGFHLPLSSLDDCDNVINQLSKLISNDITECINMVKAIKFAIRQHYNQFITMDNDIDISVYNQRKLTHTIKDYHHFYSRTVRVLLQNSYQLIINHNLLEYMESEMNDLTRFIQTIDNHFKVNAYKEVYQFLRNQTPESKMIMLSLGFNKELIFQLFTIEYALRSEEVTALYHMISTCYRGLSMSRERQLEVHHSLFRHLHTHVNVVRLCGDLTDDVDRNDFLNYIYSNNILQLNQKNVDWWCAMMETLNTVAQSSNIQILLMLFTYNIVDLLLWQITEGPFKNIHPFFHFATLFFLNLSCNIELWDRLAILNVKDKLNNVSSRRHMYPQLKLFNKMSDYMEQHMGGPFSYAETAFILSLVYDISGDRFKKLIIGTQNMLFILTTLLNNFDIRDNIISNPIFINEIAAIIKVRDLEKKRSVGQRALLLFREVVDKNNYISIPEGFHMYLTDHYRRSPVIIGSILYILARQYNTDSRRYQQDHQQYDEQYRRNGLFIEP